MTTVLLRSVGDRFTTQVTTARHAIVADEPQPEGDDLGPSPYELLLAALGACTSMTLQMYARRKGWPLAEVQVELSHDRSHAADCGGCEDGAVALETVHRRIRLEGALTSDQRERLMQIAQRCPVHQTLSRGVRVLDSTF